VAHVFKLGNAVVIDQVLISDTWCLLHELSDPEVLNRPLEQFEEVQASARDISRQLALKMAQQDCALSEAVKTHGYLSEWTNSIEEGGNNVE
tara:strand:- start:3007 stop:3282 length:276 start_codon:yes stop_codon:yes gene_type:complete